MSEWAGLVLSFTILFVLEECVRVWPSRTQSPDMRVSQMKVKDDREPPVAMRHLTTFPSPPLVRCVCFGLCPSPVWFYARLSVIGGKSVTFEWSYFSTPIHLHALVYLLSSNCQLLSPQVSLCSFSACLWTHHAMPFEKNMHAPNHTYSTHAYTSVA